MFPPTKRQSIPYQAPILPAVDFNADGKIDLVDLVMLIDDVRVYNRAVQP